MILRYLHISDLHLTYQQTHGEGWALEQFNQDLVTTSMLDTIHTLVKVGKTFDMVIITGDLAKRGQVEEYQVAEVFCQQLMKMAGITANRLYLVPGNHDVDRSKIDKRHIKWWYGFEDQDGIAEVLSSSDSFPVLMRKFAAFNDFAARVMGHRIYDENVYYLVEPLLITKGEQMFHINLVGLNSALFAGYDGDDQRKLALGLPQVHGALQHLDRNALVTIVFFHHPFECFHPSDNICQNRLMQEANLILTGHLHKPSNAFVRSAVGKAVIISSGASFETRESENSFNIVEIDLTTGVGEVQFYKYLAEFHRWKKNTDANPDNEEGIFTFEIEKVRQSSLVPISELETKLHAIGHAQYSAKDAMDAHTYLATIIERYKHLKEIYTDLAASVAPQMSPQFPSSFVDDICFQVLIERSFGKEYRTIERVRESRIQDVIKKHPRVVLLGDPGCGKTVTIWRLAVDYASEALEEFWKPWPAVVELGRYDGSVPLYDWIQLQGETIPHFRSRLTSGALLLLFDGLNEMPKEGFSESISQLRRFIQDYHACQTVVTCRRLDYDESLGLQQVEIEPLGEEQIQRFIYNYLKGEPEGKRCTEKLYDLLKSDSKLLELASNPLNLKLIISLYRLVGERFPRNRSMLIDGFIGGRYRREIEKSQKASIAEVDLRTALRRLAFDIQAEVGKGTFVEKDWALPRLQCDQTVDAQVVLNFAANMGLLELSRSSLRFQHQLLQEYFVALEMEKRLGDQDSLKRFWCPSPVKDADRRRFGEPVPPPPTTGWEEATIMLAGTKTDVSKATELVTKLAALNSILAARCIIEGQALVQSELYQSIVAQLIATTEDPSIELNRRIQAGALLGELEDPRFERLLLPDGYALLAPLVQVPDGTYLIGSDKDEVSESYLDEVPRHSVVLEPFWIGKFPVTNAEFACFINAGGYDSPEYWTEQGWAWKQGKFDEHLKQWFLDGYRNVRAQCLQEPDRLEPARAEDSEEMDLWYNVLMVWPEDRIEEELDNLFNKINSHPHARPCYWEDPAFNGKAQPVITTWFEAQAYCRWLSRITGRRYRLPTEAEWEAAAGGSKQKFTWGNEPDPSRLNILPSGVLRTSPVGVYPTGISIFGAQDLLGNVWEWTSTAKFPYPYRSDDGREAPFLPDCRRVVRGGSWAVSVPSARNSCRGNFPPDNVVRNYIGFRVVCEEQQAVS